MTSPEGTNVFHGRHMPEMSVSGLDRSFTTTCTTMADTENHGYGHATEEETSKNDFDSGRKPIGLREEDSATRDSGAFCWDESDCCKSTAETASGNTFAICNGY